MYVVKRPRTNVCHAWQSAITACPEPAPEVGGLCRVRTAHAAAVVITAKTTTWYQAHLRVGCSCVGSVCATLKAAMAAMAASTYARSKQPPTTRTVAIAAPPVPLLVPSLVWPWLPCVCTIPKCLGLVLAT